MKIQISAVGGSGAAGLSTDKLMHRLAQIIFVVFVFCFLTSLIGCESFGKKFIRKKKAEEQVEMVLEPEQYPDAPVDGERAYREYFGFWKNWQDELINSLEQGFNAKKQKECMQEALNNLKKIADLLQQEKSLQLNNYIKELTDIQFIIEAGNLSVDNINNLRRRLENMKLRIDKEFVYSKIKNYIR